MQAPGDKLTRIDRRAPILASALSEAVASLRAELGDASAAILVLAPSRVNAELMRRELAAHTPFVRVHFGTASDLRDSLAEPALLESKWTRDPTGWLRSVILARLRDPSGLGPYGPTVAAPGWLDALHATLFGLETAGVEAAALLTLPAPPGSRDLLDLLGGLLGAVRAARLEAGFIEPGRVDHAALEAAQRGATPPGGDARGVVLFGDVSLPERTQRVLTAWLRGRPTRRIELPSGSLPFAPLGVFLCAPHATPIEVLGRRARREILRTPDPQRECNEAVRRVIGAIEEGTALDRIALVVPDGREIVALREALRRAAVPATWLVGPPLGQTRAAGVLLQLLDVAVAPLQTRPLYELLGRPGLQLRRALGPEAADGRGRWRRLLVQAGVASGAAAIADAVRALGEQAEVDAETKRAAATLAGAIDGLAAVAAGLPRRAPFAEHAAAFRALADRWAPPGPDKAALLDLLGSAAEGGGPRLAADEARRLLESLLSASPALAGHLADPAVRVLSPMQALGGDFDLVCMLGLTEGRLPRAAQEDPLLPDGLADAIGRACGVTLPTSREHAAQEARRFAFGVASARGSLILCSAAFETAEARPLLPSSALFSTEEGARLTHAELIAGMTEAGRRSRPWPAAGEPALDAAEHGIRGLHEGDPGEKDEALRKFAAGAARALLAARRGAARVAAGERGEPLRPHAGFVPPTLLRDRALAGEPQRPQVLAELIDDPGAYFIRRMLGAYRPPALPERSDPLDRSAIDVMVLDALGEALDRGPPDLEAVVRRQLRAAAETIVGGADPEPDLVARVLQLAERPLRALLRPELPAVPVHPLPPTTVDPAGPFVAHEGVLRLAGSEALELLRRVPSKADALAATAEAIEIAARGAHGATIEALRFVAPDGERTVPAAELTADLPARLGLAAARAAAGYYPGSSRGTALGQDLGHVAATAEALASWERSP